MATDLASRRRRAGLRPPAPRRRSCWARSRGAPAHPAAWPRATPSQSALLRRPPSPPAPAPQACSSIRHWCHGEQSPEAARDLWPDGPNGLELHVTAAHASIIRGGQAGLLCCCQLCHGQDKAARHCCAPLVQEPGPGEGRLARSRCLCLLLVHLDVSRCVF